MYFPKVEIVKNIVINNQTINYNIDVFPNQVKSTTLLVNDVVIYMDSIFNAGDNAEILYRQKGKKTHKNSYFVLSKKSNDWDRLKDEFKLLEYGSTEFKKLYKETKLIYSSHADKFILNYDNSRSNECNFIFLQHGVINNDMSNWLFDKKIDNIVSSLDFETKLLNKVFLNSEILEVGLARFNDRDTKIKRIFKKKKYITYFTSWSEQLLLMNNQEFLKSGFYKRIIDFTTSVDVKRYANKNKYEIKVVVHPQLRDKINDSNISEYLYTGSYREIIKDTGFAITDYSSVIYELDHLGIPCLFFNQKEYEHEYFCQKKIIKDIGYENRSIKHINNISEFTNDNIKQENNEKIKNN